MFFRVGVFLVTSKEKINEVTLQAYRVTMLRINDST
jgi:hypothetical protein